MGHYSHANALLLTQQYGCPDPYAMTEMEDNALAVVADRMGMLALSDQSPFYQAGSSDPA